MLLQARCRHFSAAVCRHGQYDLNSPAHALTQLGREQAEITAQRIAQLAADNAAIDDHYGRRPVRLVRLVHSDVTRAAETAAIIAKALPSHVAVEADSLLAEGYPCVPEPCRVQV
jgi:broad specificity phosphatase PhoE